MSSTLDELLAAFKALPDTERAAIAEKAVAATSHLKWVPNPGPQTDAYFSPADILLYGGQGGGGKSDLGLGLAYSAHERSLILRREYTNLGALTDRLVSIHGARTGFNGSPPPKLRFSREGRECLIAFGANQHLGDEQAWQGQPFDFKCVGRDTPVLMADGNYRPIHSLRAGELVATLEGPRRITKVWPVRRDQAVRLSIYRDGAFVCSQDQSLTHEVLTPSGWVCHGTSGAASRPLISEPIQSNVSDTPSKSCAPPSAGALQPNGYRLTYQRQAGAAIQGSLARSGLMASCVFWARRLWGLAFAASCASRQGLPQPLEWFARSVLPPQNRALCADSALQHTSGFHADGARSLSAPQDLPGHCWSDPHQHDEHAPQLSGLCSEREGDLFCLRQSYDAARPSPIDFEGGGREQTPKYTRHTSVYAHPYSLEIRPVAPGLSFDQLSFASVQIGEIDLYDIEVEEVNHFVTLSGVVNKNCFDEATQFLELQVRFHLGWIRSTTPGQRCRAVLATNPPINSDGDWIIGFFRPWLDLTHPNPARPGQLRWYVTAPDGTDLEVDGPTPIELDGRTLKPMSRTFIPAALRDNPYLIKTDYQAKLDALPEPIRSAVRDGNFMATRKDADRQIIPTQWIIEAQARWTPQRPAGQAQVAIAADIAQGGADQTVITARYGGWFDEQLVKPGVDTPDGASVMALIVSQRRDASTIILDMGGGYGGATKEKFDENGIGVVAFNGAHGSAKKTRDGSLGFYNRRAEAYWTMREELDPEQEGGSVIALPPDPQLRSELAAATYSVTPRGIKVESKDDIKKRLGVSPDKADSAVMCLAEGKRAQARQKKHHAYGKQAMANTGHSRVKAYYRR